MIWESTPAAVRAMPIAQAIEEARADSVVSENAHYRSECPIYPFAQLFLVAAIGQYPVAYKLV